MHERFLGWRHARHSVSTGRVTAHRSDDEGAPPPGTSSPGSARGPRPRGGLAAPLNQPHGTHAAGCVGDGGRGLRQAPSASEDSFCVSL